MGKVASVGQGFPSSSSIYGAESATGIRLSTVAHPLDFKILSFYKLWIMLTLATTYPRTISAIANFSLQSTSYKCGQNVICLGEAHEFTGNVTNPWTNGIQVGRMSLTPEPIDQAQNSGGLVYYNASVRLLDPSTRQSASFATSFKLDIRQTGFGTGDGMTFVMSANPSTTGAIGCNLGIFNNEGTTSFKTIVVEFDTYNDTGFPNVNDIDNNHVSFDFSNVTTPATVSASTVNVTLWDNITINAWVEYSNETQQLEVRVSYNESRPIDPLLNYTVNMFDVAEEYMWVGFSAANTGELTGDWLSNYYVGDWTFESYGIAPSSPAPGSRAKKLGPVVGISLGVLALLLACILIVIFVPKRLAVRGGYRFWNLGWGSIVEEVPVMSLEGMPEKFTYNQLSVATCDFSKDSKLGQGGSGSVYLGVLPSSGIRVAVKKINSDSKQGEKEFLAEVSIISKLRHRNLIQLLGWCKDVTKEKYLLVYELMPHGSLDKVLFGPVEKQTACLSWPQRFNILTGTAAALNYLHQGWKQKVIHRDIKSSNIMLDQDWNAKLGDFGLARLVDHERTAATCSAMAGTYGYIAPEIATFGKFTEKADVYAFGVVALEVACGRKALLTHVPEDEMLLVDWVWHSLSLSKGDLLSAVDKRLCDYDHYWMEVVLSIGLLCAHPNPLARPSMRHVVRVLDGDAPVPSIPSSKPCLVFSPDFEAFSTDDSH